MESETGKNRENIDFEAENGNRQEEMPETPADTPETAENGAGKDGKEPEKSETDRFEDQEYRRQIESITPEYVNPEEQFRIVEDGAILSMDIEGSTAFAKRIKDKYREKLEKTQKRRMDEAAGKFQRPLAEMMEQVEQYVHLLGGKLTDQIGDGTVAIFEGEDAEKRAYLAAQKIDNEINRKSKELKLRMTADLVEDQKDEDPDLIIYNLGDEDRRIAGITGKSIDETERLHDQQSNQKIRLSDRFDKAVAEAEQNPSELADQIEKHHEKGTKEQERDELEFREKFIPLSERGETQEATARKKGIYFIHLDGFDELIRKSAQGDEKARKDLDKITQALIKAEKEHNGKIQSVFNEKALVDFKGKPTELKSGLVFAKEFTQSVKEAGLEVHSVMHIGDDVIDAEVGRSRTLYDEAVNLAARLATEDETNLGLTKDAEEKVESRLEMKTGDKYTTEAKGIDEPVEWAEVEAFEEKETPERENLLGREKELEKFDEMVEQVEKTDSPAFVSVLGEAGMGKTSLINAGSENRNVLQARAESYQKSEPYVAFKSLSKELLEIDDEMDREMTQSRVLTRLEDIGLEESEIKDKKSLFNLITSADFDRSEYIETLDEEEQEEALADILAKILSREKATTILQVEDVHFYDSGSARLMEKLADKLESSTLMSFTARPEEVTDSAPKKLLEEVSHKEDHEEINLSRFPQYEFTEKEKQRPVIGDIEAQKKWWEENKDLWFKYIDQKLDFADEVTAKENQELKHWKMQDFPGMRRLASYVSEKSNGNPFYAEEILRYLAVYHSDMELLVRNEQGEMTFGEKRIEKSIYQDIPAIEEIEVAKLETLDQKAKEILKAGSVVGMRFSVEELEQLLPPEFDKQQIESELRNAVERGFITPKEDHYEFNHELIQGSIYRSVADREYKQSRHDKLLEYFEDKYEGEEQKVLGLLERHARNGSSLSKAVEYARKLGKDLYDQNLYSAAAEKLEPIILEGIFDEESDRYDRDISLDEVLEIVEDYRGVLRDGVDPSPTGVNRLELIQITKEWVEANFDTERIKDDQLSLLYVNLAIYIAKEGADNAKGKISDYFEKSDEAMPEDPNEKQAIYQLKQKAVTHLYMGETTTALKYVDEAWMKYQEYITNNPEPEWTRGFLSTVGYAYSRNGELEKAREVYSNALRIAKATDSLSDAASAALRLGESHLIEGDTTEALKWLSSGREDILKVYRGRESATGATILETMGRVHLAQGRYQEAIDKFKKAVSYYDNSDSDSRSARFSRILLARAEVFSGKVDQASKILNSLNIDKFRGDLKLYQESLSAFTDSVKSSEILEVLQNDNIVQNKGIQGDIFTNLAVLEQRRGNEKKAKKIARKAKEAYGQNSDQGGVLELEQALSQT